VPERSLTTRERDGKGYEKKETRKAGKSKKQGLKRRNAPGKEQLPSIKGVFGAILNAGVGGKIAPGEMILRHCQT